jgi:hypothetical protein
METPTAAAISLMPADFASSDSVLERLDLRLWPPGGGFSRGNLRLSLEDFTGDMGWLFRAVPCKPRTRWVNGIKVTGRMRLQLDCQSASGI